MSDPLDSRDDKPRGWSPTVATLLLAIPIALIAAAIALPRYLESRKSANESGAIGALKTIATAQGVFREGDKEADGNLDYGMLSELSNTALVDQLLGSGEKQGYCFAASYSFTTSEFLWFATANPSTPGRTGDRYFVTNQAGVIFYSPSKPAEMDTFTCSIR